MSNIGSDDEACKKREGVGRGYTQIGAEGETRSSHL